MVGAEELRIGNYVLKDGLPIRTIARDIYRISNGLTTREPITLTEEWLEKLNFKKVQGGVFENISLSYWVNNTICCFYNETDKENFLLGHAYTDFNGKYHVATAYWTNEVHTLQNYYKANTRKELEVKS